MTNPHLERARLMYGTDEPTAQQYEQQKRENAMECYGARPLRLFNTGGNTLKEILEGLKDGKVV